MNDGHGQQISAYAHQTPSLKYRNKTPKEPYTGERPQSNRLRQVGTY